MIPDAMRHLLPAVVTGILEETTDLRAAIAHQEDDFKRQGRLIATWDFINNAGWIEGSPPGMTVPDMILSNAHLLATVLEGEEDFKLFVSFWLRVQAKEGSHITSWKEWRALALAMYLDERKFEAYCAKQLEGLL